MNQQCHSTRSLFGPYLDGELGPRALRRLEGHLEECRACRDELAAEKQVADALAALPEMECPGRVDHRIRARLAEEPRKPGLLERLGLVFGSPGWKTVTACAAALVVLVLFLPATREQNPMGIEATMTASGDEGQISHQEAYQARQTAKASLAYVANLIDNTEKTTVNEVLSKKLPKAIRNSLQRVVPVKRGGSGS